jgi:hypothetical protein
MNLSLGGGHLQGIRIVLLFLRIPSQFPVPDGLTPAVTPNCGIRSTGTEVPVELGGEAEFAGEGDVKLGLAVGTAILAAAVELELAELAAA